MVNQLLSRALSKRCEGIGTLRRPFLDSRPYIKQTGIA